MPVDNKIISENNILSLNNQLSAECTKSLRTIYVDVYNAIKNTPPHNEKIDNENIYLSDGVHLTGNGYRIICELIYDSINVNK